MCGVGNWEHQKNLDNKFRLFRYSRFPSTILESCRYVLPNQVWSTKDGQIDSPVLALVASGTVLGVVAVNFLAGHAALLYQALFDPESEVRGAPSKRGTAKTLSKIERTHTYSRCVCTRSLQYVADLRLLGRRHYTRSTRMSAQYNII